MNEKTPHEPDHSGNRWETAGAPADEPAHESAHESGAPAVSEAPTRTSRFPRARAVVAGATAVVVLVGGVGGFALGRATADDDRDGPGDHQQVGFPPDGDDDGPGFSDDDGDDDGYDSDDDSRDGSNT